MNKPYYLNEDGCFVIEDYQHAPVFADFFPGVAGLHGIPMWAFFVNRGQAVSSFGIESKDKAILEFQPANKAYRLTSIQGFRTFLKVSHGAEPKFYEPFANAVASPYKVTQRMIIASHDLTIEEVNITLGIKVKVNYFTMPQEPYAALVRRVTIENIGRKKCQVQCVDGLPAINPYGLKDWLGKHIGRTVEAWSTVHNINRRAPFYQFKVEVADTPQVTHIDEGNFYFAFDPGAATLLDVVVEAACIFGQASDFLVPEKFMQQKSFVVPSRQETTNRTPCAFSVSKFALSPSQSKSLVALTGFAHDLKELNALVRRVCHKGMIERKADCNRALIEEVKGYCFTHSASMAFDQYCGQTFLDNVLRGGLPISLQTAEGPAVFNVYSRKHGDLERDYNFFTLAPTFFSQGNGNYRDVNQNRRNDIWFNRDVKDGSIINFMNLIQADGYNPLVVKGATFALKDEAVADQLVHEFGVEEHADLLKGMLKKGFMPGDLVALISRTITIDGRPTDFLTRVLGLCTKQEAADPGEGFWVDHWTYNLDLMESYLSLYPDHLKELLLDKKCFSFFLNEAYVLPREARYHLTHEGVRQYHALAEHDNLVQAKAKGHRLRVKEGQGDVYHTSLLVKLLCLLANKVATLDPSGIGIEMEANKPGWYDALNGLPGLLGSSISETFEVKRFAQFAYQSIEQLNMHDNESISAFEELTDFIEGLTHVLSTEYDSFNYWQKANDLKEHYRQSVRCGIRGGEKVLAITEIKKFLRGIVQRCDEGIAKAKYSDGTFATYFTHEVTKYEQLGKGHHGYHHVRALAFERHDLPLFLEGFVHAMRVGDATQRQQIYRAVKKSKLYDKPLGMYKVNADLSGQSEEIGRTHIFPAGWLENESVWLHMEYKYLLELLRGGLAKEFFSEMKTALVPFLDPITYGRSILENSSFIVSSAHEDKNLHGQGFVARLSGSTSEFLHMWLGMNVGFKPFSLAKDGHVQMSFDPALPSWFFTTKAAGAFPANTYAFKLFATIVVVYHNPQRKDTFGPGGVKPQGIKLTYATGKVVEVKGAVIAKGMAEDVRNGSVDRIEVLLG